MLGKITNEIYSYLNGKNSFHKSCRGCIFLHFFLGGRRGRTNHFTCVWHHEGRMFISYPHAINNLFSCSPLKTHFHIEKSSQKFLNTLRCDISSCRHFNIAMTSHVFQRAAVRFLSFSWVGTVCVRL